MCDPHAAPSDVHTICLFDHPHPANDDGAQLELQRNAATDAGSIVIDLPDLESVDSTPARLLLHAHPRAREQRLMLSRPTAAVRRTLAQSHVAEALPFSD